MADHEKSQNKKTQSDLLDELHPIFKPRVIAILETLRKKGWRPKIIFAKRSEAQQADAIRRKASPTMLSWHVRSTIGLVPVPNAVMLVQVVHGNAVDIVDERYGWEGLAANKDFAFWKDLGDAAREQYCEWGGDWKPKITIDKHGKKHSKDRRDVAHVQMKFIEQRATDTADV
jgi:hypothetical protein